jgi:hypothetical protein
VEDVRCLHHDGHAPGFDRLLYAEGNLLGEALLDLQTAAERLSDARKLREAEDKPIRDVPDGDLRGEAYAGTGGAGTGWDVPCL